MDDGIYTEEQFDILEAVIAGIHKARAEHPILSTLTTRADSVLLANAALQAIHAAGFKIVKNNQPSVRS
jgi:hypothetical protein